MSSVGNKVFLLGLDGGSWNLLLPLMDKGFMPNLKEIYAKGVSATLHSTQPPYTGPAWVSSLTGVNPGKHGIFGFTTSREDNTQRSLISSRDIRATKLWQYLDMGGKTSGFINVPVTYPVERLNGFMISGFLAPQEANDISYPQNLYQNLVEELGSYIVNVQISGRVLKTEAAAFDFINDIQFCIQKRFEALKLLWDRYAPDFLMIVFTCLDKIQHKFWKFMDIEDPLYHSSMAKSLRPRLFEVYQQVDQIIGCVIERLDKDTTLFIISDHGFGPLRKRVFINNWLKQQKLLSVKKHRYFLHKILSSRNLKRMQLSKFGIGVILANPVDDMIDYDKSLFYSSDVYEQGIYFNSRAKAVQRGQVRYEDEMKKIEGKIKALADPKNGDCFVDEVRRRETIYEGPYVNQAPDLLLKMKNYGYLLNKSIPTGENSILRDVTGPEGCHRLDGIFAAYGYNISHKRDLKASILDVAPTVLYTMDMSLPKDLDGKTLTHIFTTEFQKKTRLRFKQEDNIVQITANNETGYSKTEEREIRSRLKELGYLD